MKWIDDNITPAILRVLPAAVFLLFPAALHAQYEGYNHPELQWETIETEHFKIHFHTGEYRTPRLIAKIGEEIYHPVTGAYHFEPDAKIDIVVRDHDDYSNGAAYYYDNKIEIWAPSLDFLLRGTSNWLRNVVTHEFTHMIQMQTARKMTRRIPAVYLQYIGYEKERRPDVLYGFPDRIVSYPLAGTVIPGWFAEGVAQYSTMELGYDTWDSHRDMILRMRALNGTLYSLADMGVFGKSSIGNESVYNQGFSFVSYLAHRYGDNILEELSRAMSSSFSVSIDRAIRTATGTGARIVYESWKTGLENHYESQARTVRENLRQGDILLDRGSADIFPKWSPDGTALAFLSNGTSDFMSSTGLYVYYPRNSKTVTIKAGVVSSPAWDPAGDRLVYVKPTKNDANSHFDDLYLYDLESGRERQVTHGKRARYPSFSPDGSTIFFVSSTDGLSTLNALDVASGDVRIIRAFPDGRELFVSTVSPRGDRIVLSVATRFGRDLAIINTDGTNFRYLLNSGADERNPAFSPDGSTLYYSCDKTGIYNIYELDFSSGTSRPVTNVIGGAFMPAVNDAGELAYSLYTGDSYRIVRLSPAQVKGSPQPLTPGRMVYEPLMPDGAPETDYDDSAVPDYEARPYTFQYQSTSFLPRIVFDYGKPKLGVYAVSSDVLNKYSLFMGAAMNGDLDRDLFALLDFRKFRQTLFLELYNVTRHADFFFPPREKDEVVLSYWEVDAGARQKLSETQQVQVKGVISRQSANVKPIIPGIVLRPLKYDYFRGMNVTAQWRYRNIVPRLDSDINPAFGREIVLDYWFNSDKIFEDFAVDAQAGFLNEIFRRYNYHKVVIDWREYLGVPFADRSSLTLHLQGGFIDRPVDDFLYFFAGGIRGLKGYSYYSIEGRNMLVGSATYRFPLKRRIGLQAGPWYFDKLYGSVGFQAGDAWETTLTVDDIKTDIDLGLRLDMYSFYTFPTKIGFNAAYGFDRIPVIDRREGLNSIPIDAFEGRRWKFFLTVLFGYDF